MFIFKILQNSMKLGSTAFLEAKGEKKSTSDYFPK